MIPALQGTNQWTKLESFYEHNFMQKFTKNWENKDSVLDEICSGLKLQHFVIPFTIRELILQETG